MVSSSPSSAAHHEVLFCPTGSQHHYYVHKCSVCLATSRARFATSHKPIFFCRKTTWDFGIDHAIISHCVMYYVDLSFICICILPQIFIGYRPSRERSSLVPYLTSLHIVLLPISNCPKVTIPHLLPSLSSTGRDGSCS